MDCVWRDRCDASEQECEDCAYITPYDDESLALAEYEDDLKERITVYEEVVAEQGGDVT